MSTKLKGIWITREILFDKKLSLNEKVILAQIRSMSNKRGCFATNIYFSEILGVTKGRASIRINCLNKKGYITTKYTKDNKRTLKILNLAQCDEENLGGTILENNKGESSKSNIPSMRKQHLPISENDKHYNNIYNIKYNKHGKFGNVLLTKDEYNSLINIYGAKDIDTIIKKIDIGIEKKGYIYDNYFNAIIDWISKY